jgi:hypothetical protein
VRVIDFERALSRLTPEHQSILLLTYLEHQPQDKVSTLTGVSVRALSYKLPPPAKLSPRSSPPSTSYDKLSRLSYDALTARS